jgi:hypothetical protein
MSYTYTRITIIQVIALFFIALGISLGYLVGIRFFGRAGGILCAIVGFFVGQVIARFIEQFVHRSMFKELEKSSNEQLWKIVSMSWWNFYQTIALLQLAKRGQDVRSRLPRIVDMLESNDRLTRIYGWDALRLVFTDLMAQVPGYNPRGSVEECRRSAAELRRSLPDPEHS